MVNYFFTRLKGPIRKAERVLARCPVEDGGCGGTFWLSSPTVNSVLRCERCNTRLKA